MSVRTTDAYKQVNLNNQTFETFNFFNGDNYKKFKETT